MSPSAAGHKFKWLGIKLIATTAFASTIFFINLPALYKNHTIYYLELRMDINDSIENSVRMHYFLDDASTQTSTGSQRSYASGSSKAVYRFRLPADEHDLVQLSFSTNLRRIRIHHARILKPDETLHCHLQICDLETASKLTPPSKDGSLLVLDLNDSDESHLYLNLPLESSFPFMNPIQFGVHCLLLLTFSAIGGWAMGYIVRNFINVNREPSSDQAT